MTGERWFESIDNYLWDKISIVIKKTQYYGFRLFIVLTKWLFIILLGYMSKMFFIWLIKAWPLITLILTPIWYIFIIVEGFITFYLLFRKPEYYFFIKNHSVFIHKLLNKKLYMPHDFFIDIFLFISYRAMDLSLTYYSKMLIFIFLFPLFILLMLCLYTSIFFFFSISFYILFSNLWDNMFLSYERRILGRVTDCETAQKYFNLNLFLLTFILGHNLAIICWYHKIYFFGRKQIYFHNLSVFEKISIFWKTYFSIINRNSNYFCFILMICCLSFYKTIFFVNWKKYPYSKWVKLFFYKLNYYLMEDLIYTIRLMNIGYGTKYIQSIEGKLLL